MTNYLYDIIAYTLIVISFVVVLINNKRYQKKNLVCNEETYLSAFMCIGLGLGCIINASFDLDKMIVTILLGMLLGEAIGSCIPKKKKEVVKEEVKNTPKKSSKKVGKTTKTKKNNTKKDKK